MLHSHAGPGEKTRATVWTVIVAGGSGLRFGERKQFIDLAGKSVLERSVETALEHSHGVVIVVPDDSIGDTVANFVDPKISVVGGGSTRAKSVRFGLGAIEARVSPDDVVLIHDAARPLASNELYQRLIAAVSESTPAVVPVIEIADTLREVGGGTVDRSKLRAVQTPQAFRAQTILEAHSTGEEGTDDASLVELMSGVAVMMVEGEAPNRKITTRFDFDAARAHLVAHARQ